jgi:hypothetical protein
MRYNSFILGNSCTQAYKCKEWQKYLGNGARAIRFFDNSETIGGICDKLQALDRDNAEIKNILIVADWDSFNAQEPTGCMHAIPPDISPKINPLTYQLKFMQKFMMPNFFFPYLVHKWNKKYLFSDMIHNYGRIRVNITNDAINPNDRMIAKEGNYYWIERNRSFPKRKLQVTATTINHEVESKLKIIRAICQRHHTRVDIVISPDYRLKKINGQDIKILQIYFGKNAVHDFSGYNKFTCDKHNYYDRGHYRPPIGNKIMDIIYKHPTKIRS